MKTTIMSALFAITLFSCRHSEPTNELGFVIEKQYSPEFDATGTSVGSDGKVGVTSLHKPEQFLLVFKCQHGVLFTVNDRYSYADLNKGDTVQINYRERRYWWGSFFNYDYLGASKYSLSH